MNQWGQPTIQNMVGSLDVDILIDEGPDTANLMQDAYEIIKDDPTIPWQIKLKFMPMPESFRKTLESDLAQQAQQPDPKMQAEQIKAQATQQTSQASVQVAQVKAQAETYNAQQDALARQQDQQLEREKAAAEREKIMIELQAFREKTHLEMVQSRQDHELRLRELHEQHITAKADHAMKRKEIAMRPKKKASAA
jgi:hypothetical protein